MSCIQPCHRQSLIRTFHSQIHQRSHLFARPRMLRQTARMLSLQEQIDATPSFGFLFRGEERPAEPSVDLYQKGIKLQIHPHVPPTCAQVDSPTAWQEYPRQRKSSLAALSREYPPLGGGRLGSPMELEILAPIRTGTSYHTQLVKVKVANLSGSGKPIAAKVYDPLRTKEIRRSRHGIPFA